MASTLERKFIIIDIEVLITYFRSEVTEELKFIQANCDLRYCRLAFCVSCREKRAENGFEKGKSSPVDSKCLWNFSEVSDDMVQTRDYPADKLRNLAKFSPPIEVTPVVFVEGTRKIKMKKYTKEQISR